MTNTLMTPDDYNAALGALTEAAKVIASAPLDDMLAYTEYVEKLGEAHPEQMTETRAELLRAAARVISASIFMRKAIQLGGKGVV